MQCREVVGAMPRFERKLSLIAACAVILLLGLAFGCRCFFVTPTLSSIAIGPSNQTLTVNPRVTLQMSATGTYSDGSTKDLTGKVSWSSSNTSCATVSTSGLVS